MSGSDCGPVVGSFFPSFGSFPSRPLIAIDLLRLLQPLLPFGSLPLFVRTQIPSEPQLHLLFSSVFIDLPRRLDIASSASYCRFVDASSSTYCFDVFEPTRFSIVKERFPSTPSHLLHPLCYRGPFLLLLLVLESLRHLLGRRCFWIVILSVERRIEAFSGTLLDHISDSGSGSLDL
ncbi:unnamed protein product [Calypogeia fissa]